MKENETIDQLLARMSEEGYQPVRRTEEPIFQEKNINGKIEYVPVGRIIKFEGKKEG
ncbi:NETI motif-containing protein [Bacillus smithii]